MLKNYFFIEFRTTDLHKYSNGGFLLFLAERIGHVLLGFGERIVLIDF